MTPFMEISSQHMLSGGLDNLSGELSHFRVERYDSLSTSVVKLEK